MSFLVRFAPYILLSLLTILSLWKMYFVDGLPIGHDLTYEMVRLSEYKDALFSQILPRYAPHTYGGLGSPVFTFYAPLFTFGASLFAILTGSLSTGVIVWFTLLKTLSVLSVYKASSSLGKYKASLLAVVWCFLPYGFLDIYTRNAFAEATALYLFPLVGLALMTLWNAKRVTWKHILLCTCIGSIFFLSHNLTIVLSGLFSGIGVAMFTAWHLLLKREALWALMERKKQHLRALIMSFLCAFGLTAWFLLPILFEKSSVHLEELTTGKFLYTNNFTDIGSILFNVQSLAFVGPAVALLLGASIGTLLYKTYRKTLNNKDIFLCCGVLLTSISVFCMTATSSFIWKTLSFFPLIQFPWRFQLFASIGVVLILAGIWKSLPKQQWLTYLLAFLILVQSITFGFWNDSLWQLQYRNFDQLSSSEIAYEGMRSTVGDEYIPMTFDLENFPLEGTPLFLAKNYETQTTLFSTIYTSCRLERNHLGTTNLLAYPFLTVESDQTLLTPENGFYAIPAASDCIRVTLKYTAMQQIGIVLLTLTLLFMSIHLMVNSLILPRKRVV